MDSHTVRGAPVHTDVQTVGSESIGGGMRYPHALPQAGEGVKGASAHSLKKNLGISACHWT